MLVIPAIDLLAGAPVRLVQGRYDRVLRTVAGPLQLAQEHAAQGATWLHVIDLDGARAGHWCNLDLIAEIVREVGLPVQAGVGARDRAAVAAALKAGVRRVIVSTAVLDRPELLTSLAAEFADQLVIGLDARRGHLLAEGWSRETGQDLLETASRAIESGARRVIYTDTQRDGTLAGGDHGGVTELVKLGVPVLAAGGISSLQDLGLIRDAGAEAAVVGRAIFGGSLNLADAIATA